MSEFTPEHRGEHLGRVFSGTKYHKIYKLVEVTEEEIPNLNIGDKVVFSDTYDNIIKFNGEEIHYIVNIEINNMKDITNLKTVPYTPCNIYSNVLTPPFQ